MRAAEGIGYRLSGQIARVSTRIARPKLATGAPSCDFRSVMTPAIFGLSGLVLSAEERAFFREADPAGYIIFGRNVENREQLRALGFNV